MTLRDRVFDWISSVVTVFIFAALVGFPAGTFVIETVQNTKRGNLARARFGEIVSVTEEVIDSTGLERVCVYVEVSSIEFFGNEIEITPPHGWKRRVRVTPSAIAALDGASYHPDSGVGTVQLAYTNTTAFKKGDEIIRVKLLGVE